MPYKEIFSRFGTQAEQIDFLKAVVDSLPVAVFCKDVEDNMRVLIWNKSAEKIFGATSDQVVGRSTSDVVSPELAKKVADDDYEVARNGKPVFVPERTQVNLATNELIHFRIWKIPLQAKSGKLILCIAQDITEMRRAEETNREQERRLKSISQNVPGLLYQFKMDTNGRFSFPYFSKKAGELLGVADSAIEKDAQSIISLIHKDDMPSFEKSLLKTINELTPWRWEGRFFAKGERLRWFQGASTPMKQEDGSILWDGILIDITAQKEAEEQLRTQAAHLAGTSKLVALGEMAGGVAHEINTPLNAILFCAEQIQSSLKEEDKIDKDELVEMSELISQTAQRIAKIVRGLKTFARDGSNESLEEVDVEMVIDQALNLCSQRMQQSGVTLEFLRPSNPLMVECRSVQLGQVVLNLVNNAFDAVVNSKWAWIKVEVRSDENSVFIDVTDSGNGLSPDVKAKLFQPFFTTKGVGKGTGIGLSISKGIIEGHEGRIFVDEKSPNTKFVIELPLKRRIRGVA